MVTVDVGVGRLTSGSVVLVTTVKTSGGSEVVSFLIGIVTQDLRTVPLKVRSTEVPV